MLITDKNLVSFAASLADQSIKQQIALVVEELTKTFQFGETDRFAKSLEQALRAGSATLDPQSRQFYADALLKLKFAAFPLLGGPEQRKLLAESLLFALNHGIDVRERLSYVFFPFYRGKADQPRLNNLLEGFENNNERLGSAPIKIGTSTVEPVVKNWMLDFRQGLREGIDAAVAVATYVSNSQNARTLASQEEQELLKTLVQTYAWLRLEAVPKEMLELDLDKIIAETPEAAVTAPTPVSSLSPVHVPRATPPPPAAVRPEFRPIVASRPASSTPPASRPQPKAAITPPLVNSRPAPLSARSPESTVKSAPPPQPVPPRIVPKAPVSPPPAPARNVEPPRPLPTDSVSKPRAATPPLAESFHPTFSLSGALANAGQDKGAAVEGGKVQVGKTEPALRPSSPLARAAEPVFPPPAPPTPSRPMPPVVDLSRKTILDINQISHSADLQKIQLQDMAGANFDEQLARLKGKIIELAAGEQVPVRQVLNHFYRSPLYNLYVAIAVAVMNDAGSDQTAAFDKVVGNYQAAKKDVLTREQFLSLNRFKKEVSQLG